MPKINIGNRFTAIIAFRYYSYTIDLFLAGEIKENVEQYIGQDVSISLVMQKSSIKLHIKSNKYMFISTMIDTHNRDERSETWKPIFTETELEKKICEFFEREWMICSCGVQPRNNTDDKCRDCAMLWYVNEEDVCPICLQNDGVWTKLCCGHLIHKICIQKCSEFGSLKCPLCRTSCYQGMIHGWPFLTAPQEYIMFRDEFEQSYSDDETEFSLDMY